MVLVTACALGALAVILGAFGAHGLKGRLSADALLSFETGVRYQFIHVLAMLAAVWLYDRTGVSLPPRCGLAVRRRHPAVLRVHLSAGHAQPARHRKLALAGPRHPAGRPVFHRGMDRPFDHHDQTIVPRPTSWV
jgi:hypothetical protein